MGKSSDGARGLRFTRRRFVGAAAALLVLPVRSGAAEDGPRLIMFRRAGCPWCAAWDREIAPAYPNTDIGRALPMQHLDLDRDTGHGILLDRPVRYTPTFVLVDAGAEIGRIEGYPGQDFFWGLLEELVAGLLPDTDTDTDTDTGAGL
jgi:thioredoxin-related protein